MKINEDVIRNLNYLCKTYDTVTQSMAKTAQRLIACNPEADKDHQPEYKAMESIKGNIERRIRKELEFWPVWTEWLSKVSGVGGFIGGNLVLMYYYRFLPICGDCGGDLEKQKKEIKGKEINVFVCVSCGKQAKGDGVLNHRIDHKEFNNVSSLWHYMGRHVVDGKMPKRAKGVVCDWSTKGRTLCYQIGDQFNRQKEDHPYKAYLLKMKKKHERKNNEREKPWTKGHIQNAARNEASKLFLSHFWHVARSLEGKSTDGPYVEVIMKHTGIISPYYWKEAA